MDEVMSNVHRAYARIAAPDHPRRLVALENELDGLLALAREVESELLRAMKPVIAVSLKWRFDYLCKTLESPFELEADVRYWTDVIRTLRTLGNMKWFDATPGAYSAKDPWKRTADGFDLGWTTTTAGEQFEISKRIAKERLDQILGMLGGPGFVKGKKILDSGCGPGRMWTCSVHTVPKK